MTTITAKLMTDFQEYLSDKMQVFLEIAEGKRDIETWNDEMAKFLEDAEQKNKEVVICAAVKTRSGKVFRGHRHADAIKVAHEAGYTYQDLGYADQGFITSKNRYVGREEGRKIQDAAGIKSADPEGYRGTTLYSEDLY